VSAGTTRPWHGSVLANDQADACNASSSWTTIANVARRLPSTRSESPARRRTTLDSPGGEDAVRAYLRALVGAPVRPSDRVETAEPTFVHVIASWAERVGVQRQTLAAVGVSRSVLDRGGVRPTPLAELIRRNYTAGTFGVADLVRRSGASDGSVRAVVAEDERAGRLRRVGSSGRTVLYGLR